MNTIRSLVLVSIVAMASSGVHAQGLASDPLLASFQAIVEDLNENDLDSFVAAVDHVSTSVSL